MCRGKVFSARLLSRFSYQATILLCIAQSSVSCYSAVVSIEKAEESLKAPTAMSGRGMVQFRRKQRLLRDVPGGSN